MDHATLATLTGVFIINVAAWLTPGANMLAVISAAISGGRRTGLMVGLGLNAGSLLWATAAVLGVTAVFELAPAVTRSLRLAGAVYLLWLGAHALRAALSESAGPSRWQLHPPTGRQAFRTGFLVSATNPKAALFFGSILTIFVPPGASPQMLLAILAICLGVGLAGHAITATLFSRPAVVAGFTAARRPLTGLTGALFTGFGLAAAWDATRRG